MRLLSVLFLVLGLIACSDNQKVLPAPQEESVSGLLNGFSYSGVGDDIDYAFDPVGNTTGWMPPKIRVVEESDDSQDQKIIKTADLAFETEDIDTVYNRVMGLVEQYKGFVQSDNSGKNYGNIFRTMVVRIPSENFQPFVDAVSDGIEYFDRKDISRQDVTEEFVDLEARLRAKNELEKRYLELLTQAKNVKEMLDIERELSKIREEIEAKEGRLNYLKDRVSISTVQIHMYRINEDEGIPVSYGQKMGKSLKSGWNGISSFFLGVLSLWPLWIILVLLTILFRKYLKRRKKRKQQTK